MYDRSPPIFLPLFFALAVVSAGLAIAILVATFWMHAFGELSYAALRASLVGAVVLVGALVVALVAFVLAYQLTSSAREAAWRKKVQGWIEWWRRALAGEVGPAPRPLPSPAIEAWLRLREEGESDKDALEKLARDLGVVDLLLRRLRSKRRARRLAAIEDLSRARLEEGLEPLLAATKTRDRIVQHLALRGAARTLAKVSAPARERATGAFIDAVAAAGLPTRPLEEVLLLPGDAAAPIVTELLSRPGLESGHLRAALAAARQLGLRDAAAAIEALGGHEDPEVRSAALQSLAAVGNLSSAGTSAIHAGLADERAFLRIHATRASAHLPEPEALEILWDRLGDPSWWVRVAAAETLRTLGAPGRACLERAARSHPDRFARDLAGDHGAVVQRKVA